MPWKGLRSSVFRCKLHCRDVGPPRVIYMQHRLPSTSAGSSLPAPVHLLSAIQRSYAPRSPRSVPPPAAVHPCQPTVHPTFCSNLITKLLTPDCHYEITGLEPLETTACALYKRLRFVAVYPQPIQPFLHVVQGS